MPASLSRLRMVSLPLDVALTVLVLATCLVAVQLIILTVELSRLRRDVELLLRTTASLNHAVNPWAGEDETTEPSVHNRPPKLSRRRFAGWFRPLRKR